MVGCVPQELGSDEGHYTGRDEGHHAGRDEGHYAGRDESHYVGRNGRDEGHYAGRNGRDECHFAGRDEGHYVSRDEGHYVSRDEGHYAGLDEGQYELDYAAPLFAAAGSVSPATEEFCLPLSPLEDLTVCPELDEDPGIESLLARVCRSSSNSRMGRLLHSFAKE